MSRPNIARLVLAAPAVLTAEKSFRRNPVIGSHDLNKKGLHRRRVALAARMAERRRAAIAPLVDADERARFDRDGFVIRHDALPADLLARVREEIATRPRPAWEMRQGQTVNRVQPLPHDGSALASLHTFVRRPDVANLIGYAAGRSGTTLTMLQTIVVDPTSGEPDPQAHLHADTFHPTAKFWLFLHDVGADEGPFAFVPGSHRLTPERLAWEDEQALSATSSGDPHHAAGSFRLEEHELSRLGYGPLEKFPVPGNTLVVADTYGFHRRVESLKPTVRTSLYGISRRNPFMPWNGLDVRALPYVRDRGMDFYLAGEDRRAKQGRKVVYKNVGSILAGAGQQL